MTFAFRKSPADRDRDSRRHAAAPFESNEFEAWPDERAAALTFIGQRESPRTAETYSSALAAFFRWCAGIGVGPFEVRRSHAKRYLAELSSLAPCTRAARCGSVRSFYNDVLDDDEPPLDRNPFAKVGPKQPKPVQPTPALTQAQFEELLAELAAVVADDPRPLLPHRDLALVYLMGRLGPRAITTSGLRWGSFSHRGDTAFVKLHLKGDRYDEIEVPPDVLSVLARWYERLGEAVGRPLEPKDAVFPAIGPHARELRVSGTVEPISQDGISYIVKKRLRLINVTGNGWAAHSMRATAATVAHERGATVEEIQSMLCHLNRQQTEGYIRRRTVRSAARHWTPAGLFLPALPAGEDVLWASN